MSASPTIQLMVPRLPPASAIAEFIAEIDRAHIYTNDGPLNQRFCRELADFVASRLDDSASVFATTVTNGTAAIELGLQARALEQREYVVVPSYTFVATAHAVVNAGWQPYFVDVDEQTLTLPPEIVERSLADGLSPAAVVVVSPFGGPVDVEPWEAFEAQTGVPVVFDMAAAVMSLRKVGPQPVCVSLHATKMLGLGEGGAVLSSDEAFVERIKQIASFGFEGRTRTSTTRGGNYRISEYAAAVGLASLRDIERKANALRARAEAYRQGLAGSDAGFQPGFGAEWIAMSMNLLLPSARVERTLAAFDTHGVPWRRWWAMGCHEHPIFADAPRTSLPITQDVAFRTIGVPFHEFLSDEDIGLVCEVARG